MELTAPIRRRNGRRVSDICGYEAYDDALAALRLISLMGEEDASAADKRYIAWKIVFVDGSAQKEGDALLARAAWELYGIDIDGSHSAECGGNRIIDWEGDAARIAASVRQVYGVGWEEFARETSFKDACAMIGMLPKSTPMGAAVYYRTAEPPKANGKNSEQVNAFRKLQKHYEIKSDKSDATANDAMTGFAQSLRRANG